MDTRPKTRATLTAVSICACACFVLQQLCVPLHLALHGHFAAGGRVLHVHRHSEHAHVGHGSGHAHTDGPRTHAEHVSEHASDDVHGRHSDDDDPGLLTELSARPALSLPLPGAAPALVGLLPAREFWRATFASLECEPEPPPLARCAAPRAPPLRV